MPVFTGVEKMSKTDKIEYKDTLSGNTYHITPTDDLKEHTEVADTCECKPRIEAVWHEQYEDLQIGQLVVHNSYDRREYAEPDFAEPWTVAYAGDDAGTVKAVLGAQPAEKLLQMCRELQGAATE